MIHIRNPWYHKSKPNTQLGLDDRSQEVDVRLVERPEDVAAASGLEPEFPLLEVPWPDLCTQHIDDELAARETAMGPAPPIW